MTTKLQTALQFAYQNIRDILVPCRDSESISQVKDALRQAFEDAVKLEEKLSDTQKELDKCRLELSKSLPSLPALDMRDVPQ